MIKDCLVLDDLSLDDHMVHCEVVREEIDPEIGEIVYLKAMEEDDSGYNVEYEEGIGCFWKMMDPNDERIVWPG